MFKNLSSYTEITVFHTSVKALSRVLERLNISELKGLGFFNLYIFMELLMQNASFVYQEL